MDMLERVARAIADASGLVPMSESSRLYQRQLARAAIEAMREPTQDQLRRASLAIGPYGGHGERGAPSLEEAWQAMIDAALAGRA